MLVWSLTGAVSSFGAGAAVQIATITLAGTAHPTAKDFLIIA